MDTHNTLTKQDEIELLIFDKERIEKRLIELGVSLAEPRATLSVPIPTPTASGISTAIVDATLAHTPGPWKNHLGYIVAFDKVDGDPWAICGIYRQFKKRSFAYAPQFEHWSTKPEQSDANARLIVAAPDMLRALRGVVRVADRNTNEFIAARTAIAKATANS